MVIYSKDKVRAHTESDASSVPERPRLERWKHSNEGKQGPQRELAITVCMCTLRLAGECSHQVLHILSFDSNPDVSSPVPQVISLAILLGH